MAEYDLDAMFPEGAVDDETRREVLRELLSNTRHILTKQLRWSIFWSLFVAAFLAFCLWSLSGDGSNPWFWVPMTIWQGSLLLLWAFIWSMTLRERDKVDACLDAI